MNYRWKIKQFFYFLGLWSMIGSLWSMPMAVAQNVTFQADVNRTTVSLGGYVRLTLTATGVQHFNKIKLPDIDGFESEYLGPSSRISIINGQQSSSFALLYNLYPKKTGDFVIPSIQVAINGQDYKTNAIKIKVVDQAQKSTTSDSAAAPSVTLKDKLFFTLAADKTTVYLNEKIPVVVRLYINGISVRNVELPSISQAGFLMDDFGQPAQYTKLLSGMRYNVVEFKTNIYPTRVGQLTIGPASETCNIIFKNEDQSRSGGLFDDDFFSGFFNSYTTRPVQLQSKPLLITVKLLPEEGKPADFSGAVGNFSFNVDVSPKKVKVGDPVTVRMKVTGTGSLKTFELKGFESSQDFKAYDPEVKEENGAKTLEQVLIPLHESATHIPEVSFSFFDTEQGRYRTISWGPVQLDVEPVSKDEGFAVVGPSGKADNMFVRKDTLGKDISFIKDRLGHMYTQNYRLYKNPIFIMLCLVIVLGWIAGIIFYHFNRRIMTDERFARRLQAPRYARVGLRNAATFLKKKDMKKFYDELFLTLQKYFSHKLHMPPGAVSAVEIRRILEKHGKEPIMADKIKVLFDQCEAVRYASVNFDDDQMTRSYWTAQEIIDWFERKF